jgi:amino acid adenylation domain-containing protein
MLVQEFLEWSAERSPDKTALVCGQHRLTYREIDHACDYVAHELSEMGVRRGDRIGICLENSVEAVIALFGVLKIGAVFMMIHPTTKAEKLSYVMGNSRAACLITDSRRLKELGSEWMQLEHLSNVLLLEAESLNHRRADSRITRLNALKQTGSAQSRMLPRGIDIDLAALIYTSGSTGLPKGVMMTHANMVAAATSITTCLENRADDIILNVLPLSFNYGMYQVLMTFMIGGTLILERSFTYPQAVMNTLIDERVTGFPIVPTISAILLQMDLSNRDLGTVRYITNTAAALPTHHIGKLRKAFPNAKLYSMYGLTECKRACYLPPEQIERRPTSVGRAMPNTEVYIVDEWGHRVRPGVVGELVVRGANVMKGYWDMPLETENVLRPGLLPGEKVLHTGDLFRMDEEGYLYFVSRKDDMIKSRGEKVSPMEIENVLYSLDEVQEAAVVGVPDDILGQAIKAVVTIREGTTVTVSEIQRHCARHLEDVMVPKYVEIRSALPKTSTGKINKRVLASVAGAAE